MTPKQAALAAITALPDDATWDTVFAALDAVAPRHTPEQLAEWQRRMNDYTSGKTKGIPGDEVMRKLDAMIAAAKTPATVP